MLWPHTSAGLCTFTRHALGNWWWFVGAGQANTKIEELQLDVQRADTLFEQEKSKNAAFDEQLQVGRRRWRT